MKIKLNKLTIVTLLLILSLNLSLQITFGNNIYDNFKKLEKSYDIQYNKIWSIKFNQKLNPSYINNSNIYVLDKNENKITNNLKIKDYNVLLVYPPTNGYTYGEQYKLIIIDNIYSLETGNKLKQSVLKEFEIKSNNNYEIVDTGQVKYYNDTSEILNLSENEPFYGQDANYNGTQPKYIDNGDDTITDNVTGLTWQKKMDEKMTFKEAFTKVKELNLGGYNDWRVPTIKELYSLIQFTGYVENEKSIDFFIDTDYFEHPLGDTSKGEREIDAQTWSSTEYAGRTMNNDETVFGVNFVDGRIKGYPKYQPKTKEENKMYFRFVRGNTEYGKNNFIDNNDGTISDLATGLMWQKADDGTNRDWEEALKYAEKLVIDEYSDWRLPNAKELQSIVDYSRSLQTTNSAAIDPIFEATKIIDVDGFDQYPFYWTSTTHLDGKNPYNSAVYIAFGEAQGKINNKLMDVHGAGAQRSDPKSGDKNDYPDFWGPQGDVRYVYNYVRCVRNFK